MHAIWTLLKPKPRISTFSLYSFSVYDKDVICSQTWILIWVSNFETLEFASYTQMKKALKKQ